MVWWSLPASLMKFMYLSIHAVTGSLRYPQRVLTQSVCQISRIKWHVLFYLSTMYPFLFSPSWSLASNNVSFVPSLYFIITSTILGPEWGSVVVNAHGFCRGPEISSWHYAKHLTNACNSAKPQFHVPGFWGTWTHVHSLQTHTYTHTPTWTHTHTKN